MKAQPQSIADPPEAFEPEEISLTSLVTDEDELTDEKEFYLAQEVAFASLRARYAARPRRKM